MFNPNDFDIHRYRQQDLLRQAQRQRFAFSILKANRSQRDSSRSSDLRRGDLRRTLARVTALFF